MLRLFKNKKPLVQNTAKMDDVYKSLQDSYLKANAYFCHFRVDALVAQYNYKIVSN